MMLSQLMIYPIKSAGGISLTQATVTARGLQYDRRWMLVDSSGSFLSQRQHPKMALIRVRLAADALLVEGPGMAPFLIPTEQHTGRYRDVQVWADSVQAVHVSGAVDAWFSTFLNVPCSLVLLPDQSFRQVERTYAQAGDQVGFADGFPFLLISEASLNDLNARLEKPLPMNRFRPNLVVTGTLPFAEDGWSHVRIGEISFRVVKPCARCIITATDQETARVGREPLWTLATYRRKGTSVLFGQNLIHDGLGKLVVGDAVEPVEE